MSFSKYNPEQHKTLGTNSFEAIIELNYPGNKNLSWQVLNILETGDCTKVQSKTPRGLKSMASVAITTAGYQRT